MPPRILQQTQIHFLCAAALSTIFSVTAKADTVINGCTIIERPINNLRTRCPGVDLSGQNLAGMDLSQADFTGANLSGADLSGTNFGEANLSNANFNTANLSNASLWRTTLTNTTLAATTLTGARTNLVLSCPANLPIGWHCLPILYTYSSGFTKK